MQYNFLQVCFEMVNFCNETSFQKVQLFSSYSNVCISFTGKNRISVCILRKSFVWFIIISVIILNNKNHIISTNISLWNHKISPNISAIQAYRLMLEKSSYLHWKSVFCNYSKVFAAITDNCWLSLLVFLSRFKICSLWCYSSINGTSKLLNIR